MIDEKAQGREGEGCFVRIKPTAYGRATLAGSAIPASRPVGVGIAIGVAVAIENRTRRAITHLGSLQFRADRDSDGDPDEPVETPRFLGQAKATAFSRGIYCPINKRRGDPAVAPPLRVMCLKLDFSGHFTIHNKGTP